ncbi:LYR motif-containing protein 9-like [Centruroides vittatus]|uniref:LYR motif-containing protein 9-like n=1 Tax=Centruroides vittatus TaxID=120091 RepID=UPI00351016AD
MAAARNIQTPVSLYKFLLKQCRRLPKSKQEFYKHQIRQSYNSHSDESDPERIQQIIKRAIEDSEWVVNKYANKSKGN